MLVLSRKRGESIVLPECQAIITVLSVNGNRIRLGVTAPHGIPVHRMEVWTRVCKEASLATDTVLPTTSETQGACPVVSPTAGRT